MIIRRATLDDAPALVALRSAVYPYAVRGAEALRYIMSHPLPGEHRGHWVAEVDGEIVGFAVAAVMVETTEVGFGMLNLYVHPGMRNRGIGTTLLDEAMRHHKTIGSRSIRVFANPDSLDFARKHGFEPGRELRYSSVDPRLTPPIPPAPDDVTVVPYSAADPRLVFAAAAASAVDEPSDVAIDNADYDGWLMQVWENLDLDKDSSFVAMVDGEVVASTMLETVGERTWSGYTGTIPQHRGRGLAKLLKATALHQAAAKGVTIALTSNDETNGPMLAVNTWLGYRPIAAQFSCVKKLTGVNL